MQNNRSDVSLSTTILQHLRWLDFVEDAVTLSSKLMECVEICPFDVQRDVILMLPEIVGDVALDDLVTFLLAKMEETPSLTVAILDALTNLHLNEQDLNKSTSRVVLSLQSSEPEDLPVVVRFLLTSCRAKDQTMEVLKKIRQYLSSAIESNNLGSDEQMAGHASSETLMLEALRVGLRQRYDVASMYLKGFTDADSVGGNGAAKSLDVWMLATMHGFPRDRQAVETTLKKLVIDHKLDESTIEVAIEGHSVALSKNFESLVSLASMLVGATARKKSVAKDVRAVGRSMFLHLFTSFESTYHRQEIVGKLMTHIGSGSKEEIDTALAVFVLMVDDSEYIDLLCPFSAFLRCLIDYVEHLSMGQVRKIFYVLCTMAEHSSAKGDDDDTSGDAELNILLRKLLASTQANYRAIGIVAGSAMVLAICNHEEDGGDSQTRESGASQIALSPQNNKAKKVLELMLSNGHDSANLEVLHALYDEISMLITKGHELVGSLNTSKPPLTKAVADWLELECVDKLRSEYLVAKEEDSNMENAESSSSSSSSSSTGVVNRLILGGRLKTSLWYDLDGAENDYALNVSLLQQSTDTRQRESLMLAPPLLRLVQSILSSTDRGIGDIDMVLGCPLLMYDESALELSQESTIVREFVCSTLFHAVNWFRQVLNTFVGYEDAECRIKVLRRAHQLIELEDKMQKAFNMTPHFRPPVPELLRNSLASKTGGKKKRKVVVAKVSKSKKNQQSSTKNSKKVPAKKKITAKAQMKKISATAKDRGSDSSDDSSDASSGTDSENEDEDEDEDEEDDGTTKKGKGGKKTPKSSSSSSSSSSSTGPSDRMLNRLSKEAQAVFSNVVQATYRPLHPSVCTILSFDIGAKNVNTLHQTMVDSVVHYKTSMPLRMFLLQHFYRVLKKSLPKRMTSSPFGRRNRKQKDALLTPLDTMELYLKDLYVRPDDDNDEEEDDEGDVEGGAGTNEEVNLGSTWSAVASIFAELKLELREENPAKELFPMLRLVVQSVQVLVECNELKVGNDNARVLLRGLQALTKRGRRMSSSQESSQDGGDGDGDDGDDDEDEENDEDASPWFFIVKRCRSLSTLIGGYVSSLVDLEKDAVPFLSCIAAIAGLQNHATAQCELLADPNGDGEGGDYFDLQAQKERATTTHYTASKTLKELCFDIMSEGWGDANEETGIPGENMKNSVLGNIINMYLQHSEHGLDEEGNKVNNRMKATEELVETHLPALIATEGAAGPVDSLLSLHKKTLPCYFSTLLNNLVELTRGLQFSKSESSIGEAEKCLYGLQKITNWLQILVGMTKSDDQFRGTLFLTSTLKSVRAIIDILNKQIDTFFKRMMSKSSSTRNRVLSIFKKLQKSTRQAQNICTHGKNVAKNMSLASLIPHVKRALETFVFKINSLFVSMGQQQAVTLGNLKHKGLDGKEVSVDSSSGEDEEADEEADEEEDEEDEDEDE